MTCRRVAPLLLARPFGRRLLLSGSSARPAEVPAELAISAAADVAAAGGYLPVYRGAVRGRFTGGAGLGIPVAVLLAEADRLLPPSGNRCPAELPPHTTWELLPGAGHIAMWDDAARVARAILGAET